MKASFSKCAILALIAVSFLPNHVMACASCFGDPNSSTAQAMNWAIGAMLIVTGGVFTGIGAVVYSIWKRTKIIAATAANLDLPERDAHHSDGDIHLA